MRPEPHHRSHEYSGDKARGGEIILRRRWQRLLFIGALAAAVVLVLLMNVLALSTS